MQMMDELLGTRIGNESSEASSRNTPRNCPYCQAEMHQLTTVNIGGQERGFGPWICDCSEFQAERAERDQLVKERQRQAEETQHKEKIERLFRESKLPARWHNRTFEQYQVALQNKAAYESAWSYADHFDPASGDGLLFTGSVGTGKTHLSAAIAMHVLQKGYSVLFGTVATLLAELRHTYDTERLSERDVMRRLTRCDLLIIDDLGKEKISDWVEQTVYEVINTRYENNKALVITTNLTLSEIREKYHNNGDALVDRILEVCRGVQMKWPSWRKKGVM